LVPRVRKLFELNAVLLLNLKLFTVMFVIEGDFEADFGLLSDLLDLR